MKLKELQNRLKQNKKTYCLSIGGDLWLVVKCTDLNVTLKPLNKMGYFMCRCVGDKEMVFHIGYIFDNGMWKIYKRMPNKNILKKYENS